MFYRQPVRFYRTQTWRKQNILAELKSFMSQTMIDINDYSNLLRIVNNEKWPAFFKYKGKKFYLKIYK